MRGMFVGSKYSHKIGLSSTTKLYISMILYVLVLGPHNFVLGQLSKRSDTNRFSDILIC